MNTYSTAPTPGHGAPESFLSRFGQKITGVLSGFDRILFRGSLRLLYQPNSMEAYLATCGALIKDFGAFSQKITKRVKALAYEAAEKAGRPVQYLNQAEVSKEELARQMARRDGIDCGLIAVITAVEPCWSYALRGDRQKKEIHLVLEKRKCTHLYHYYMHPEFGLMHVRVQTWFPFSVTICLNGREWLARQMDRAGVAYRQADNCFVWVEKPERAQALLDQQLHTDWNKTLRGLLIQAHPLHAELERPFHQEYYWSAAQTEYATDLIFEDPQSLAALYPQFLHHAIRSFGSASVLRFLGRAQPQAFRGEVTSTLKRRPEGVCVRHTVNGNSIKIYDKQGSVLRVETTVVHPEQFKVYRPAEGDPDGKLKWRKNRRGVADLWRRGEVSRAANGRYLEALASVSGSSPLKVEAVSLARRIQNDGRLHRAINPWSEKDGALLEAISRGEFTINGFRNRDLRKLLYPGKASADLERKHSAAVSRQLALLKGHGLIKKIGGTHRWMLTQKGRRIITALLAARQADVDKLTQLAA